MVEKEGTNEVTHYVEKPETFVSSLINCGLYAFSPAVLDFMGEVVQQHSYELDCSTSGFVLCAWLNLQQFHSALSTLRRRCLDFHRFFLYYLLILVIFSITASRWSV